MRCLSPLWKVGRALPLLLLAPLALPIIGEAEARRDEDTPRGPRVGWSTSLQGGYVHQLDTDIDGGGHFAVDRLFIQGGISYAPDRLRAVSLSLGYSFDGYRFSGSTKFAALDPWDDIHSLRIGLPIRWGFDQAWTLFVIPTVRLAAENGAALEDALSGGGLVGFSYRFGDRLTIGPGVGVITRIEDDPSVFPILIIEWRITERFSLETGRGLGATRGPGLTLSWRPSSDWNLSVGGRYEDRRFRLDDADAAPNGVGQDRGIPLFGAVTYSFGPRAQASLVGGVDVGGELRLEDEAGARLAEEDHDVAGFAGFTLSFRF